MNRSFMMCLFLESLLCRIVWFILCFVCFFRLHRRLKINEIAILVEFGQFPIIWKFTQEPRLHEIGACEKLSVKAFCDRIKTQEALLLWVDREKHT